MPFQKLGKNLKSHVKNMLNGMKYGDNHRKPLTYIPTHTSLLDSLYQFPPELPKESPKEYQDFPRLSKKVLVSLFKNIGVHHVPEIALYELKEKTPLKSFRDFCLTFGVEDELINSNRLNSVIERLQKMDTLRTEEIFDSRPIYKALAYYNLNRADKLIDKRKI